MTDNEIIKALECCTAENCLLCTYNVVMADGTVNAGCLSKMIRDSLDLINRQKAEIERLNAMIDAAEEHFNPLPFRNAFDDYIEKAKSEARKEFAERLDELFAKHKDDAPIIWARITMELLLKEMESESK